MGPTATTQPSAKAIAIQANSRRRGRERTSSVLGNMRRSW